MLKASQRTRALGEEHGFSLIELLVVLALSIVVVGALYTIVDAALQATSRTVTKVNANQRARTTLATIVNDLKSGCTGNANPPVQQGSSSTSVIFNSQFGSAVTLTPAQHQITLNTASDTLTDTVTSGGKTSTLTLLTNVQQDGTNPVFTYYAFESPAGYTDAGGNPYMMLLDGTTPVPGTNTIPPAQPLSVPLSQSDAQSAAEVTIDLKVGGDKGSPENTNLTDTPLTVKDAAVLTLDPVANHAGGTNTFGPCQ